MRSRYCQSHSPTTTWGFLHHFHWRRSSVHIHYVRLSLHFFKTEISEVWFWADTLCRFGCIHFTPLSAKYPGSLGYRRFSLHLFASSAQMKMRLLAPLAPPSLTVSAYLPAGHDAAIHVLLHCGQGCMKMLSCSHYKCNAVMHVSDHLRMWFDQSDYSVFQTHCTLFTLVLSADHWWSDHPGRMLMPGLNKALDRVIKGTKTDHPFLFVHHHPFPPVFAALVLCLSLVGFVPHHHLKLVLWTKWAS